MKKQKSQSLTLHKKAISSLSSFIVGGKAQASDSCQTQDPQTPTAISACRTTCPINQPTRTCN
ncbi:hypothetical protein U8527_21345 [Kordia algicida OT-1]|uniref:Uncharacterized protein n=1 Tax=Kordia algicida OT-1 TaxID=391587 RepID=A9DLF8_9FLAO|nr:hypothetical protein [Kordia algicida]EDP98558.1 hypothetical protein KAOT1_15112 [Kordia algicida OT-1]